MKPARFDYVRAETPEHALSLLAAEGDDVRILAGGQSLVAMLNMRLARPKLLVDVMHIPALATMSVDRGRLVIGAGVRQAKCHAAPDLPAQVPLLAQALMWVGHPQTRARGTICGSVAHADPSAEIPLVLATLGAEVALRSKARRRVVSAGDFFLGTMLTERADDELIEAVHLPLAGPGTGTGFAEVGRRRGDFAIVAVAAVVSGTSVRVGIGGVNDTPVVRAWPTLSPADEVDALNDLAWSLDARDDLHASARYRREMVRRLGRAAISEARQCAD